MNEFNMSEGLARVRARFVEELDTRLARMTRLRTQLDNTDSFDAALNEIGQISHKIAGTAATLGFRDLGSEAADIDDLVMKHSQQDITPKADMRARIDLLLTKMRDVAQAH